MEKALSSSNTVPEKVSQDSSGRQHIVTIGNVLLPIHRQGWHRHSKRYRTIKWINYAFEVLYTVTHLIVSMEWAPARPSAIQNMVFGTLGFEMLMWIDIAILNVTLLYALGPRFLHIQSTSIQILDDGHILEVPFSLPWNICLIGNGLDRNDFVWVWWRTRTSRKSLSRSLVVS